MMKNTLMKFTMLAATMVLAAGLITSTAGADPLAAPNTPTNVLVGPYTQGNSYVNISWSEGFVGNPPAGYTVTALPGGQICTTSGVLNCAVQNLVAGTTYTFSVKASNGIGTSPASKPSENFTPTQLPGPVGNLLTQYTAGNTYFSVSWSAPTVGWPAPSGYTATIQPSGVSQTLSGTTTSATFSNLTIGTTYTVSVYGTNIVGNGTPATSQPVTITAPPGPVNSLAAGYVTGYPGVTVTWTAPTTGYPAPSGYTVVANPGGQSCTTTLLYCSFTTLTPGATYTFSVTATNTVGTGPASVSNPVTVHNPPPAPGRPSFTALKPGATSVTLSWTASSSCGASCIYTVFANGTTKVTTTAGTRLVVTHLVLGAPERFSVTASNGDGTSDYSPVSAPVTAWIDVLRGGQAIGTSQYLWAANRNSYVSISTTGQALVRHSNGSGAWAVPGRGNRLGLSAGGNITLTNNGQLAWSSRTHYASPRLVVVNGGLEIFSGSRMVWRNGRKIVVRRVPPPVRHPVTTTTVHYNPPPPVTTTTSGTPLP